EVKNTIGNLQNASLDQLSYLRAVYDFILDKTLHQWEHTRGKAALRWHRLFVKNLDEIWQAKDFVYCYAINFAAYALLANSKFFKPEDVEVRHVFFNFVPHQYLR